MYSHSFARTHTHVFTHTHTHTGGGAGDVVTLAQAHLAALAGGCMALGLRYAGSGCVFFFSARVNVWCMFTCMFE